MELDKFIKNFTDQFDELDSIEISAETEFRDIKGWSSFTVLSVIAMADEYYNVKLTNDDIRNSKTVFDLFTIIKSRIK